MPFQLRHFFLLILFFIYIIFPNSNVGLGHLGVSFIIIAPPTYEGCYKLHNLFITNINKKRKSEVGNGKSFGVLPMN